MKKSLLLLLAMVMVPLLTHAQEGNWTAQGIFPADSTVKSNHGIAIDAEGKIWVSDYYATGFLRSDSAVSVVDVRAFYPDGTEADFSPVQQVEIDGEVTTFTQGRGIREDADGNILFANGSVLVRINHLTGEGMNRINPGIGSLTAPAVDDAGNVYVNSVLAGPVKKYNPQMDTSAANGEVIIETVPAIGRTLEVSGDGNTIYAPRFTGGTMYVYTRANVLVPFGEPDSVLQNSDIESIAIDPNSGDIWVSASTYLRPDSLRLLEYTPNVWYGYDAETWERVDSVAWEFPEGYLEADQVPRGIAFSNDANTLYIGSFRQAGENFPGVQAFTRNDPVSNEREPSSIPEGYTLAQNYPNPFNPTTNINYSINQTGFVSIKVYDVTGREVASLVNSRVTAGDHSATFDASNLASGIYIYALEANGFRLTNRMTLIK